MSNANTPAMMAQSMAESLLRENAALKEQNALLTVQVQKVYAALELLHDHARLYLGAYHEGQNVFDSSMDALTTLAALPQPVKSEDARECRWSPMDEMNMPGTYEGTCGVAWSFTEGGIKENEANYCPRCGGKVVDVAAITVRNPA